MHNTHRVDWECKLPVLLFCGHHYYNQFQSELHSIAGSGATVIDGHPILSPCQSMSYRRLVTPSDLHTSRNSANILRSSGSRALPETLSTISPRKCTSSTGPPEIPTKKSTPGASISILSSFAVDIIIITKNFVSCTARSSANRNQLR